MAAHPPPVVFVQGPPPRPPPVNAVAVPVSYPADVFADPPWLIHDELVDWRDYERQVARAEARRTSRRDFTAEIDQMDAEHDHERDSKAKQEEQAEATSAASSSSASPALASGLGVDAPADLETSLSVSPSSFEDDPLRLLLLCYLIDTRCLAGETPIPRDLVHLIGEYAQASEFSFILQRPPDNWPSQIYAHFRFTSLQDLLHWMGDELDDLSRLRLPHGPFCHSAVDHPWNALLDSQRMRDDYVFDPATMAQHTEGSKDCDDQDRKRTIESAGQAARPVTVLRLYQRMRARLHLRRFATLPPLRATLDGLLHCFAYLRPAGKWRGLCTVEREQHAQYGGWSRTSERTEIYKCQT